MGELEKRVSILIIEEDLEEQSVYEEFFEGRGQYQFTFSESLADALEKIRQFHFDVIVSEISFMDGNVFDLLPHARGIPFVIVTAGGDEEIAVKAIQKGVSAYILRDVERNYLKILPTKIKKAAESRRNETIIHFLLQALRNVNEAVCAFNLNGNIVFANETFCCAFGLKSNYYLQSIEPVLDNYMVIGYPDLKTYLKQQNTEPIDYDVCETSGECRGKLRLTPVLNKNNTVLGYTMMGRMKEGGG